MLKEVLPRFHQPDSPEQQRGIQGFTGEQIKALFNDGAVIYEPAGETITAQKESQKAIGKPSFWYVVNVGEKLVNRPSKLSAVAIYPDPERFFIENSSMKNVTQQERLAEEDGKKLRNRLGVEGITVIVPEEASTLTGLTFKHHAQTEVWLFSQIYAQAHGLNTIHGRTKNPINKSGSRVAHVGNTSLDSGLLVSGWARDLGHGGVWIVRLVVPKRD